MHGDSRMYDIEKINKIIKDIEKYFTELKNFNLSKENIEVSEKFYSSSMVLFTIINRMKDLAEEIIVKNEFGMPSSFEQYFEVLQENGMIDKNLSIELKKLVKDRNLFAHEYFDMDRKQVLNVSKRIYYINDFVEKVKKIVTKDFKNKREIK